MSRFTKTDAAAPARIELVMLLQQVGLFRFCSAREILRIAEIARTEVFEKGAPIFEANAEPGAIYCVIEGEVELEEPDGENLRVGPGEPFGVREVLSGRLRRGAAHAVGRTTTLVLEQDDFFDLLSNNVEIVKGLFRRILHDGTWRSRETQLGRDEPGSAAEELVPPGERVGEAS